jgi:tape measure domain-containing protein
MPNGRIDDVVDLARIDAQFQKVFLLMDEMVRRINQLNQLGGSINLGGRNGGGGNSQTTQAISAANQLQAALDRLAMAESQLGQDIAIVNERTRQQNLVNSQNARQNIAQAGSLNDLRARLAQATREFDNMTAAERRNVSQGREAIRNIQNLQAEVRALEQETGRFQRNVGNYPKAVVGGITGILGTFGVAVGAGALAKEVFDTTVRLDSLNSALKAVSKTEAEYAINQRFLLETSERLGLNILDLTQSYKLFYAASTLSGLSAEETRKIFNSVAESAATLKLSTADTQGVLLAFSQILGKGKVQAEELRGQIGERVPGAFSIAAKSIGRTEQELNKMLETGQVIAKDFLPKFAAELEKTFGTQGQEPVQGLQASINRLSNTFTSLVADNQSGLTSFFGTLIDLATSAIKVVNNLAEAGNFLYNAFSAGGRGKNQEIIDSMAFADIAKDLADTSKTSLGTLIEQRNIIDQNIESYTNLLGSQKAAAEQARENTKRTNQGAIEYARYAAAIEDTELVLKRLTKSRELYITELKKRTQVAPSDAGSGTTSPTAAQLKEQSRLREMQLKAALDARKIDIQSAIDSQKEIIDNDKFSTYERLQALDTYNTLRNSLLHESAEEEKRILKENVLQKQAVAEQSIVIDKKAQAEEIKITREGQKLYSNIIQQGDDKELAGIIAAGASRKGELESKMIDEIAQIKDLYDKKIISESEYGDRRKEIENDYAVFTLQAEAETVRKVIALGKLRGQVTAEEEQRLLDITNEIRKLGLEEFSRTEKEKTKQTQKELALRAKYEEQFSQRTTELAHALADTVFSIVQSGYQRQKDIIDQQIEDINTKRDADIAAINKTTASEQEKNDRIAVINIRAQTQQDTLNQRKRQIELQQARFEKAKSAASIVQNTASAIIKAFADFPYPLALPLSLLIGATGAAQLATVLAQPLPKYKDGRVGGRAEWAYTGDGGVNEVISSRYGTYITPDKPTLTYLPEGATVYKNIDEYYKKAPATSRLPVMPDVRKGSHVVDNTGALVKAIENNKQTVIVNSTWAGVQTSIRSAAGQVDYLNGNVYK